MPSIEDQHSRQFAACDDLLYFASRSPIRQIKPTNEYEQIVLGFFAKTFNVLKATVALCRDGQGITALPLLRVMFEDSVNLEYISQSPDDRSRQFMDYQWIEKKLMLDDLEAVGVAGDKVPGNPKSPDWLEQYDSVKDRYPSKLWWAHARTKTGKLRPIKPFDMAAHVGAQADHRILFSYASKVTHSTITGLSMYLTEHPDGNVTLDMEGNDKETSALLAASFSIALVVTRRAASELFPESLPAIDRLKQAGDQVFLD